MATHYMYIPWDHQTAGKEYNFTSKKLTSWAEKIGATRRIWKDSPGATFDFQGDTSEIVIYVRGHGSVAGTHLSKFENGTGARAKPKHILDGLIANGLKASFAGKIKFYNCHSAEGGALSFAAKCASLMRARGFNSALYFGYTGAVSSHTVAADAANPIYDEYRREMQMLMELDDTFRCECRERTSPRRGSRRAPPPSSSGWWSRSRSPSGCSARRPGSR
jgi:hypothetical protein